MTLADAPESGFRPTRSRIDETITATNLLSHSKAQVVG